MTTRTKIVFFVIMSLAVILVAGVFIVEQLAGYTLPTRSGEQVTIRVAAPPELSAWVNEAAREFEDNNPQLTVNVVGLEGVEAEGRLTSRTPEEVIDAWIAEADFVRGMAGNIPYDDQGTPVAQTKLVWLANSAYPALQDNLDWDTVHQLAVDATAWSNMGGDNFFDLALSSPDSNIEGLATLISALAFQRQTLDLRGTSVNDEGFRAWLAEILVAIPNRNRSPQEQFSQPPLTIDAGMLLEYELSKLNEAQFIRTDPGYNLILTYPYIIRNDDVLENSASRQGVAEQFRGHLLSDAQQQKLAGFGFSPAGEAPAGQSIQIDGDTAAALWNQAQFQ